jgi:adenosylcobinamide kinase/adenosylcobinamide-phosphate guanylyltransferase
MITLILGGARSGKSSYAEALAQKTGLKVIFLATAEASDDEMRAKIERHRQDRPQEWQTVETPLAVEAAIAAHGKPNRFLIVDCLTTLTSNMLLADAEDRTRVMERIETICAALSECKNSIAIVSNEVGNGVVPEWELGRAFRDTLGEFNQKVARLADNLILMVAGYPMAIKGKIEVQANELHDYQARLAGVPR